MRLTWKDAVSTVFMAAIVVIYVAFLNSTTAWLISSALRHRSRRAGPRYRRRLRHERRSRAVHRRARAYTSSASELGAIALVARVTALITASTAALAILVVATLALWLAATVRHAFTPLAVPDGGRNAHEVIHPEEIGR